MILLAYCIFYSIMFIYNIQIYIFISILYILLFVYRQHLNEVFQYTSKEYVEHNIILT